MGVLGLTPFLQKAYPHVITQLPNRLKSLSNKTVVIDGTLVTQRFHFAPMPHEYRHILGWYRLIQEFREHGIRAICVFDGEERTTAKSREYSAGTEELEFHHVGQLPPSFGVINQSESRYDLCDRLAIPDIELPEDYQEGEKWQGLASSLTDLYMDYRRGIANVEVIPSAVTSAIPPVVTSQELVDTTDVQTEPAAISSLVHGTSRVSLGSADPADTQVAHAAMSRTQYQLAILRGRSDHDESPTETILASLREKSCFMVQSLLRRSSPPTEVTYEESKSVLHAMGVPCIESTGPYEAEALASSLVLNGHADYVASEDTDVLVYGAPLLRNITSKDKPLLLIAGSEVRSALRLDAAAFVDFALLLGTDFAPRIRNIGPRRALQYIRKYGTIERILREEKKYVPRAHVPLRPYLRAVRDARDVFVNLPPVPALQMLEPKEYREEEVATILGLHRLQRFLEPDALLGTLEGNYFNDNPIATI
ncbi:PIN domain-like protein [Lactarius psammicola]|nr:PIN domain-like protein [Lactarius psammicola]